MIDHSDYLASSLGLDYHHQILSMLGVHGRLIKIDDEGIGLCYFPDMIKIILVVLEHNAQ